MGGDRVGTVTTRTSTRNLTRGDNEKTDLADEQRKLRPPREVVNDTAGQRAQIVGRVDIYGFKQRNARTNPETPDTGQTHLSTLEPITYVKLSTLGSNSTWLDSTRLDTLDVSSPCIWLCRASRRAQLDTSSSTGSTRRARQALLAT